MRIGVVSDTHAEIENLRKAFQKVVNGFQATVFIHLGDNYDDMKTIGSSDVDIIQVPGIFSSHYRNHTPPNRMINELAGWRFLISHTPDADPKDLPGDIDPRQAAETDSADVLLHGHTHIPEIVEEHGYIRINPGHLRDEDKKGYPPTFCIIDALPGVLDVKICQLHGGEVLLSRTFRVDEVAGGGPR